MTSGATALLREVPTRIGPWPLFGPPEALAGSGVVLLAVGGIFEAPEQLFALPHALDIYAKGVILRVPDVLARWPLDLSRLIGAVEDVIAEALPRRQVVLMGTSIGATVALGARRPEVRRVLAIEPLLSTAELWPIQAMLTREVERHPPDHALRRTLPALVGPGVELDYTRVLSDLRTPTDVILGETPLTPPRELEGLPSLVGDAARLRLAAHPRVRLHTAGGVGHNVEGRARGVVLPLVHEACRRAAGRWPFDPDGVDEALLEATPLDAGRVLCLGPESDAFREAYRSRNPAAEVATEPGPGGFDAVVVGGPADAEDAAQAAVHLRPGGSLIVRWGQDRRPEVWNAAAQAAGLEAWGPLSPWQPLIRLRKRAPDPVARLRIEHIAYAALLMDVRTRLPAQVLATAPDLVVREQSLRPFTLPRVARDEPKIAVLQRPGELGSQAFAEDIAYMRRTGWITVLEIDDHPALMAEVTGGTASEADFRQLGKSHALQTSTPALERAFRAYNPEIRLFPNAAFDRLPDPAGPRGRRLFYGAVARGPYAVEVARALGPVIAAFPDVAFEVVADAAVFEALPTSRKTLHPYMSYDAYLALMSRCSISLSPAEARRFVDTKSDAKFLDAARAGVLTIGSPVIYEATIRHGENGLLADAPEAWARLLMDALADDPWRTAMARAAWDEVGRGRMMAGQLAERRAWYWDLWRRRAELDAALAHRLETDG